MSHWSSRMLASNSCERQLNFSEGAALSSCTSTKEKWLPPASSDSWRGPSVESETISCSGRRRRGAPFKPQKQSCLRLKKSVPLRETSEAWEDDNAEVVGE